MTWRWRRKLPCYETSLSVFIKLAFDLFNIQQSLVHSNPPWTNKTSPRWILNFHYFPHISRSLIFFDSESQDSVYRECCLPCLYALCFPMVAIKSLTSSLLPRKMGDRWWMFTGWMSRMLISPLVAMPPASCTMNAMGLPSYIRRSWAREGKLNS